MSLLTQVILGFAGVYLLVAAAMYLGQRALMYPRGGDMGTPTDAGLIGVQEVIVQTADGLRLTSWFLPPDEGMPVVLYFHGNAGSIADRAYKARLFKDAGIGVLLAEYRGYGGNPGAPTEEALYADGRANMDWLFDAGYPADRLVVYGESLGTGVAGRLAWEQSVSGRPVAGLILEAPFTSMADAAGHHYPLLPTGLLTRDRYDTLSRIAEIDAPLLILHGRRDRTVPSHMGEQLYASAREPKRIRLFDEAAHNDLYDHGAGTAAVEFIADPARHK